MFHSQKDARKALTDIARAQQLCLKVLGLEESEGSCFALQVGKCRGACVGKEPLMLHAMRLQMALSALKIKAWPFPGRIALRERATGAFRRMGRAAANCMCSIIGCIWDPRAAKRNSQCLSARPAFPAFDAEVYRLLQRYFSNHPHLEWLDLRAAKSAAVH